MDEAMSTVYMIDAKLGHYTCMATFLAMLTVYRRQSISMRCPVNHMWWWSGGLMHVALMFVFVTMLLKTRMPNKVSNAISKISNFSFGGNCNLH